MKTDELSRLRFVAANFKQVQGLRMVAFGVFFLLVFFPWRKQGDLSVSGILLLPALAGLLFAVRRIGNWYERRFGRVEYRCSITSPMILWGVVLIVLPVLVHPGSLKSISAYMYDFNGEWWFGCVFAARCRSVAGALVLSAVRPGIHGSRSLEEQRRRHSHESRHRRVVGYPGGRSLHRDRICGPPPAAPRFARCSA